LRCRRTVNPIISQRSAAGIRPPRRLGHQRLVSTAASDNQPSSCRNRVLPLERTICPIRRHRGPPNVTLVWKRLENTSCPSLPPPNRYLAIVSRVPLFADDDDGRALRSAARQRGWGKSGASTPNL